MCTGEWSVAGRTVDTEERGGVIGANSQGMIRCWEWVLPDAEGQHQGVPAMGRGKRREKRRGRGYGMGAEDGELWSGRVRSGAADWRRVGEAKAAPRCVGAALTSPGSRARAAARPLLDVARASTPAHRLMSMSPRSGWSPPAARASPHALRAHGCGSQWVAPAAGAAVRTAPRLSRHRARRRPVRPRVVSPYAISSATTCTGCRSPGLFLLILLHAYRCQAAFQHTLGIRQGQAEAGKKKPPAGCSGL